MINFHQFNIGNLFFKYCVRILHNYFYYFEFRYFISLELFNHRFKQHKNNCYYSYFVKFIIDLIIDYFSNNFSN